MKSDVKVKPDFSKVEYRPRRRGVPQQDSEDRASTWATPEQIALKRYYTAEDL